MCCVRLNFNILKISLLEDQKIQISMEMDHYVLEEETGWGRDGENFLGHDFFFSP